MSRPLRPLLLLLPALAVPLSGCSTAYSRMYSPAKSYYKAPPEDKKKDEKLPTDDATLPPPGAPLEIPGGMPPGDMPPAPMVDPTAPAPAADPLNMVPPATPPPL